MNEDQIIVQRVLEGDPSAFRELIKTHEKLVFHMVNRLIDGQEDREDLCQEIFLKVFRKLPDFRFQSRLSTWIATIAYRMSLNYLKKHKNEKTSALEDESFRLQDLQKHADQLMDQEQVGKYVHQLIAQLPVQYRTVLTLYHLEEMPYADIGKICNMPEGTVKNYLFRARKLLKEKLEQVFKKEELL